MGDSQPRSDADASTAHGHGLHDGDPLVERVRELEEQLNAAARARQLSDSLFEIGRHLNLARDTGEVAKLALGLACDALCVSCGSIDRRELGGWVTSAIHGTSLARVGVFHTEAESPTLAEVTRTGAPAVVRCEDSSRPDDGPRITPCNRAPHMTFPLTLRDRVVGALTFCSPEGGDLFDDEAVEFGRRLAMMLSLAEENSLNMRRHERIAEAFQRALIGAPLPHTDVGHLYVPATDPDVAGGDFYDVFALDSGRVAFAIGDVSGRGLAAATMTALVRDCMRTTVLDGLSPAEVLTKTNRVLLTFAAPEVFARVFFGIMDPDTGDVAYAGGGNPPPFLVDEDQSVTPLEGSGPLLGVLADASFQTRQLLLGPRSHLVCYTNGLSEARQGDAVFGAEGVRDILVRSQGPDARGLAREIHEAAAEFAGGTFKGNVAILVIGRKH